MSQCNARQIITAALLKLLLNTGRRFIYPFAPELSRSLDVPLTAITSIIATGQAASLLGIFCGPIAERTGYRAIMRTGILLLSIGMLICGILTTYWAVFAGLLIASFGKILFDPAIQAFVGKTVPFEKRARVIGLIETSWAGSTLIGIPALALLIEFGGIATGFYTLAILGGLGWLVLGKTFSQDNNQAQSCSRTSFIQSFRKLITIRPARGMMLFGFFISIANDSLFVVYGAWFEQAFMVSIITLGFSTIAIGSAELLGESFTALFSDRLGIKKAIVLGTVLSISAYLLLPVIGQSLTMAMAGMFFTFFAFELTMVSSFSLATEILDQDRATMMAGYYGTAGIGRMVGVLAGGFLWQAGGIATVCTSSAAITLLGLASLFWGLKNWKK
jgi:predicted MFS family arabinose efflux permease